MRHLCQMRQECVSHTVRGGDCLCMIYRTFFILTQMTQFLNVAELRHFDFYSFSIMNKDVYFVYYTRKFYI